MQTADDGQAARGRTESFEPVEVTLEALRGRIGPLVVWSLFWGPRSFPELTQAIPQASVPSLRRVLREMERSGLVRIQAEEGAPRGVRFLLTPRGESLKPVVAVMYEWGLRVLSASLTGRDPTGTKRAWWGAHRPS